ncbi:hypothetical protein FA95DRAFT_1578371 [Auriscalpium vulgare]|uniref:Uncharacterized protein n=1 Tax=Auriscalpium vulgare TaxID=40419 RepID=A0ACB8R256_9AGAM|nr:hypothetical protein FA95DRAFT_1578371 [Auriscalpium vulgare]
MQLPSNSVPATPASTPVSATLPGLVSGPVPGQPYYYTVTSTQYAGIYTKWPTVATLLERFPDLKFQKHLSFKKAAEAMDDARDTAALIDQFEAMGVGNHTVSTPPSGPLPPSSPRPAVPRTPRSPGRPQPSANHAAATSSSWYSGSSWPPGDYSGNTTFSDPQSAWHGHPPWPGGYGSWSDDPSERTWPVTTVPPPPPPPPPPPVGILQTPAPTRQPRGRVPTGGWDVYAVARGRKRGIFNTAAEALQQTHKFPNALMLGFRTRKEAVEWLEEQRHADREAIGEEAAAQE